MSGVADIEGPIQRAGRGVNFFYEHDLYHDESQIAGFWHGILFVPRDSRSRLLTILADIRRNTARSNPISLKNLDRDSGKLHKCTASWLQVGVAALIQNLKGKPYSIPTGKDGRWAEWIPFTETIGARFILFRVKGGLDSLNLCPDYGAKVEATFRMALKGGLTMFTREGDELCIRSLHFDGHRQYSRRLDLRTVLRNVGDPPRKVSLHQNIELNDDSSDHRKEGAQSYDDCQLLQLADLLVSGFRTVLADATSDIHRQVCMPLAELVQKWKRGPKGFANSRWSKGFCISEGHLVDGQWQFGAVSSKRDFVQPKFFDD